MICVQEIPMKDTVGIVADMVSKGTSGEWVVSFLDHTGINIPKALRDRIGSGMTTQKDADRITKLMQS